MNRLFRLTMILFFALTLSFVSCEDDALETGQEDVLNVTVNNENEDIVNAVSDPRGEPLKDKKLIELIQSLQIDSGLLTVGSVTYPDGIKRERIFIGDDIMISEEELQLMAKNPQENRQWSTSVLVTGANRTINIVGMRGTGQNALTTEAKRGLRRAVKNFNNLDTSLQMNLEFSQNQDILDNADIVVMDTSEENSAFSGGRAGFPFVDGRPFDLVEVFNMDNRPDDALEHLMTHELGHAIGLRHTDWNGRLSCAPAFQGIEAATNVGLVQIPGTPQGFDATSVMQACFDSSVVSGEFNDNDVTALETIYPN